MIERCEACGHECNVGGEPGVKSVVLCGFCPTLVERATLQTRASLTRIMSIGLRQTLFALRPATRLLVAGEVLINLGSVLKGLELESAGERLSLLGYEFMREGEAIHRADSGLGTVDS